jgi:hypothetical protein
MPENQVRTPIELRLPNGKSVIARVRETDGGAEKTSSARIFDFAELSHTISGMAESLTDVLAQASPDKATVSFELELGVKSGKLVALLMEGEGKGTVSVSLEWSKEASGKVASVSESQ